MTHARTVFLAHRIPYPPSKGERSGLAFFAHLAETRGVHLFFVDDEPDWAHVPFSGSSSAGRVSCRFAVRALAQPSLARDRAAARAVTPRSANGERVRRLPGIDR